MPRDKDTVRFIIYNLASRIIQGKATDEEIEKVTAIAKEFEMLPLLDGQFAAIQALLGDGWRR